MSKSRDVARDFSVVMIYSSSRLTPSFLRQDSPYYVRIEIFNTGEPPKEKVDQLFSPFFSTKLKGTGFGLPIAQVVVRKNLGRLEIKPFPGKGTSVIVNLPRAAL